MVNIKDALILFAGGRFSSTKKASSECHFYKIATDEWVTGPSMTAPRHCHSSSVVGDAIYIYDGVNELNQ